MKNKRKNNFAEKMRKAFEKVGGFLEKTLFPDDIKCAFCDNDVPDFQNDPFFYDCEKEISFNNGKRCLICSEPMGNEALVCDICQKNKRTFKKAVCPFVYEGRVRSAILGFKDDNKRYLAKTFAKCIVSDLEKEEVKVNRLTYVPLTDKKKRKRGYDQAELLANEIGKLLNLRVEKFFGKVKDVKTQKLSSFKERHENMRGMFKLLDVKLDKNDSILIVDDVITTGATIEACAVLCEKKVKEVYVAGVARNKLKEKADN